MKKQLSLGNIYVLSRISASTSSPVSLATKLLNRGSTLGSRNWSITEPVKAIINDSIIQNSCLIGQTASLKMLKKIH